MAYCTTAEIITDFKNMDFTTTTLIKAATVDGFIAEADALINSYVNKRYTTPVTTGEGASLLKLISRSLVSARVKTMMEVVQVKSTDANQNVRTVLFSPSKCLEILEDIQKGNVDLIGATPKQSSAFFNNNDSNGVESVFQKEKKQW
jgi:phage gp36-like protein